MRSIFYILLPLIITSCSTPQRPSNYAMIGPSLSDKEYSHLIEKNTHSDKQYSGFNNTFQLSAILIKSEIASAILQRKSETFLWDQTEAQKQREKQFQELSSQTKLVVSLYTAHPKYNDLNKPNSIWKVYLEIDGERYIGKAKRSSKKFIDLQRLYHFHNRWSELYEVSFPLPTSTIDNRHTKVTFTGSLGSTTLKY